MLPPAELDGLSPGELKALVIRLLGEVAELRRTVASLRDEIARLKGLSQRPTIEPSGMETGSKKTAQRVIDEDRITKTPAPAARVSRAMRISWCRTWCCARMSCAIGASAG